MQDNRQILPVPEEIGIGSEDGQLTSLCRGADQEIGIRTLNPMAATDVEAFGRSLIVIGCQFQVFECPQRITQTLILSLITKTR